MIVIIDYGMGNLGSVYNMFKRIGVKSKISSNLLEIEKAEKLILPGVGAFDNAMKRLHNLKLTEILNYKALEEKTPVFGICLGMQLLTKKSEEGVEEGLGWIEARSIKFQPNSSKFKVPHMGWNKVNINTPSNLTKDLQDDLRYYFVHSFYVKVDHEKHSLMKTQYGITFDSAIGFENIYGVQFHPEKSHMFGMKILKNFSEI